LYCAFTHNEFRRYFWLQKTLHAENGAKDCARQAAAELPYLWKENEAPHEAAAAAAAADYCLRR